MQDNKNTKRAVLFRDVEENWRNMFACCTEGPEDTIFVVLQTGKKLEVQVELTQTIESLKQRVFDKEGIPPARIMLIYTGLVLHNAHTLNDYKIDFGKKLFLVITNET